MYTYFGQTQDTTGSCDILNRSSCFCQTVWLSKNAVKCRACIRLLKSVEICRKVLTADNVRSRNLSGVLLPNYVGRSWLISSRESPPELGVLCWRRQRRGSGNREIWRVPAQCSGGDYRDQLASAADWKVL